MNAPIHLVTPRGFREHFFREPLAGPEQSEFFQIYAVERVAPSLAVPTALHRTTYHYFVTLTAGAGEQRVNLDRHHIGPGQVLVVRQGSITAIERITPDAAGYFIGFDETLLETHLSPTQRQAFGALPVVVPVPIDAQSAWSDLCEWLRREKETDSAPNPAVSGHVLTALILKLIQLGGISTTPLPRRAALAEAFKQLVYAYARQQRDVAFYASQLNVSTNYLQRCVREITGKAPKDLLLETLVLLARIQLQSTTQSVSEIAYGLRFEDPSYFGRLFKKVTGLTPTEYRIRQKHDLSGT